MSWAQERVGSKELEGLGRVVKSVRAERVRVVPHYPRSPLIERFNRLAVALWFWIGGGWRV